MDNTTTSPHPEWVLRQRKPGTEVRKINNKYYLYKVELFYDKEKKKNRKSTLEFLGTITEADGFVAAKSKKVPKSYKGVEVKNLSTKEYGLSAFMENTCADFIVPLKEFFPRQWEWMLVALYCRLLHTSPLKNMVYYFKKSFLSETLEVSVTPHTLSRLLKDIGKDRAPINGYMKQHCGHKELMLIDATSIVSYSENLAKVEVGLSKRHNYEPLFNLLYFYSPKCYLPAYYRLFNGNIKDVSMVSKAIRETGYNDTVVIADKGFYSKSNLDFLEKVGLDYIVPLRRNSKLIDYGRYKNLTHSGNHFLFEGHVIYHDCYSLEKGRSIYLFTDEQMMVREKRDYVMRIEKGTGGYTKEQFVEKLPEFGTFSTIIKIETNARGFSSTTRAGRTWKFFSTG